MNLPIRLSDGGDFEDAVQVQACIAAAKRHPMVQAIGYTKRVELLSEFIIFPFILFINELFSKNVL